MATKNKNKDKKVVLTKKLVKVQILNTLQNSLGHLENAIGKKKFQRRIKKASKILITGLSKSTKSKGVKLKNIILPGQGNQTGKDKHPLIETNLADNT